ncbi:MAG: IPT/TIG domain-containing protein, partial [Candidatus Methylomirabilis sp.]|nr:IPT/TIG domain-containing protein [Deltaproteobacteria bacterium]
MNAIRLLALLLAALAGCNPSISGLEPTEACPGGRVAVLGSGFGPLQGSSNVSVGGVDAGAALLWSDSRVEFRVPAAAATDAVAVEVGGTTETGPVLT